MWKSFKKKEKKRKKPIATSLYQGRGEIKNNLFCVLTK